MNVKPIRQMLRFQMKLIGCTDTCLAMLANGQALGGMLITEKIVRDASDERNPDPGSPGLRQAQLVAVADRLHFEYTDRTGHSWEGVGKAVTANRLVIAQLWYADIGGTPIGHAILITGRMGGRYTVIDPMKGRVSTLDPTALHIAMSRFATRSGQPADALYYGISRVVPKIS